MPPPLFLDLPPFSRAGGTVHPPGSKSISNRALLLAALSEGTTELYGLLDSDDTRVMLAALQQLGCTVEDHADSVPRLVRITGLGERAPHSPVALFLGNAGTAMRPLTAALALLPGQFTLSGVPRMHERPIGDLVDALQRLGCRISYDQTAGYPPLTIHHSAGVPPLQLDAPVRVRGDVSSQFLTALLMALPLAARTQEIVIDIEGTLVSKPYIHITLQLLARFGIAVQCDAAMQRFVIAAGSHYRSPGRFDVEADASSASYFVAVGALAQSTEGVRIQGVGRDSMQGDIRFIDAAQSMGAQIDSGPDWLHIARGAWPLHAIDLDCNHIPDAAMTLAVMALYAKGSSTLRNIGSWRVKETDRIAAMATELRKLGATVEEGSDWLRITPPATAADWRAASLHTYDDHRMAMCLSLAAFNPAGLTMRIEDPKCVDKTFPAYFSQLFQVVDVAKEHIPVICIDGPSASGKGTLAQAVAQQLGWHYLDSGALYRLAALAAERAGLAMNEANAEAIAKLCTLLPLGFADGRIYLEQDSHTRVLPLTPGPSPARGEGRNSAEDVTQLLRSEAVGIAASRVAAMPAVRAALLQAQRDFRALPGLVADGRDMGTVVFPDAPLKVFLTASVSCRAQRRYKQLILQGINANIDSLCADLQERDARDTKRAAAPLQAAQDAFLLDNTDMTVDEAVRQVLLWWQECQPFQASQSLAGNAPSS